jgi:hypothetical protein
MSLEMLGKLKETSEFRLINEIHEEKSFLRN